MNRLKDSQKTSSLNNLLPEDEISQVNGEEETNMTGFCMQTEQPPASHHPHRRSACEVVCTINNSSELHNTNGNLTSGHNNAPNKSQGFQQQKHNNSDSKRISNGSNRLSNGSNRVPTVVVTRTNSNGNSYDKEIVDTYEISL